MLQIEKFLTDVQVNPALLEEQYKAKADLKILFVNPQLNGNDFYKIILPALELRRVGKETGQIAVAFSNISTFNPSKQFKNIDEIPLTSKQILWAHTAVFPFTSQNLKSIFTEIKKLNPELKIVYHVDFNFTCLPEGHLYSDLFTKEVQRDVMENILAADKVIVANEALIQPICAVMEKETMFSLPAKFEGKLLLCANKDIQLEGITFTQQPETEDFHLCVIAGNHQLHDLKSIVESLKVAKAKHGAKLKITLFGANKDRKKIAEIMDGIDYAMESPVPLTRYYLKLNQLNADLFVIPCDMSEYSLTSISYKRFLDCALIGKPVIAPKIYPFHPLIKNRINGYLYDTDEIFQANLDLCIKQKAHVRGVGAAAQKMVVESFVFHDKLIQTYINCLC